MSNEVEYDCELEIDGVKDLGDSKRKGYEGHVKCVVGTPEIVVYSTGDAVVSGMNGRIAIDDVPVYGVCQNKGNLRQAILSDKTKFEKVTINRFVKIQGSKEEKVIQTITLNGASLTNLSLSDRNNEFTTVITYEKIEIKDYKINIKDGTLEGSPIVTSYNRLTGEVNA